MVIAGLALLTGALLLSVYLGGKYLLSMDREINEVPFTNLTGLDSDKLLRMVSGKMPIKMNPMLYKLGSLCYRMKQDQICAK